MCTFLYFSNKNSNVILFYFLLFMFFNLNTFGFKKNDINLKTFLIFNDIDYLCIFYNLKTC